MTLYVILSILPVSAPRLCFLISENRLSHRRTMPSVVDPDRNKINSNPIHVTHSFFSWFRISKSQLVMTRRPKSKCSPNRCPSGYWEKMCCKVVQMFGGCCFFYPYHYSWWSSYVFPLSETDILHLKMWLLCFSDDFEYMKLYTITGLFPFFAAWSTSQLANCSTPDCLVTSTPQLKGGWILIGFGKGQASSNNSGFSYLLEYFIRGTRHKNLRDSIRGTSRLICKLMQIKRSRDSLK